MSIKHWGNDTDKRNQSTWGGGNLSQYHCVHQNSHMDWAVIEPGPPRGKLVPNCWNLDAGAFMNRVQNRI